MAPRRTGRVAPNLERAPAFYRDLVEWEIGEERTDGYRLVRTADGSIGGGLLRAPEGVFPYVTIYVGVEDLGTTLDKARELDGTVIVEPMPVPEVGTFALFQDPDGAMIGIFEEDRPAATDGAGEVRTIPRGENAEK